MTNIIRSDAGAQHMPSPAGTIAWKFANALIPDAAPSERVVALDRLWGGAALRRTLERFKSTHGGLWVGGAVYLTADSLSFEPNAVNIKAHSNDVSWSLPLRSIDRVQDNFGYVTRIVELKLKDGSTVAFRCFGAKAFAQYIEAVMKGARWTK
jgi:hypothetical protein